MKTTRLENAILRLDAMRTGVAGTSLRLDSRCLTLVTVVYLVCMLSVPLTALGMLIWFAIYPLVGSAVCRIDFGGVFRKSLYVLPFVVLVGVFNPIFDHAEAFSAWGVAVSRGWVTFASIILRGLLSVQALLVLIEAVGFTGLCRGLARLGMPSYLTTQLMMVYRYMSVLLREALSMRRAREARGFGQKSFKIRDWGPFIGQLFLRTVDRSDRIHRAMLARGFNGTLRFFNTAESRWTASDTAYLAAWTAILVAMRIFDVSSLFTHIA